MPQDAAYGDMQKTSLSGSASGINVEDINIFSALTFKIKHNSDANFHSIDTDPEELEDMFLVVHYKLSDI
jgi:hypothetical protein